MSSTLTKAAALVAFAAATCALPSAASAEKVAEHNMSRYCIGEASARFEVRPQDIEAGKPSKGGQGNFNVDGKTKGDRKIEFRCHFTAAGEYKWVRTMDEVHNHNETEAAGEPPSALIRACNAVDDDYGEVLEATPLKPGAWEIILKYNKGNYVCNVEQGGKVTYFEKLK